MKSIAMFRFEGVGFVDEVKWYVETRGRMEMKDERKVMKKRIWPYFYHGQHESGNGH